jgi:hypothetical protein
MNNFAHDIAVISRSLDLKDRRIAELETMLAVREEFEMPPAGVSVPLTDAGKSPDDRNRGDVALVTAGRDRHPYPNDLLADICEQISEWDLTPEQIANLAKDIPREVGAIMEARNEAAWERQQESLMESGGHDDSAYRRDMVNAGRGHLLKD